MYGMVWLNGEKKIKYGQFEIKILNYFENFIF